MLFRPEIIFPDYPKAGVWPDAYYFSTREFLNGAILSVSVAYALDRAQALAGNPNPTIVGFLAPPTPAYVVGDGLLPSSLDGQTPRLLGALTFSLVHKMTTARMARHRMG